MNKREIINPNSFLKAVNAIQPIEPEDVDKAIIIIKRGYRVICGLPSSDAAIGADKLFTAYHGAKATEQANIAKNIMNIADSMSKLIDQRTSIT